MIRISRETDYAILLLVHLARRPAGRVVTAREIADHTGVSRPMVSKILKALARGGLLRSHRGARGGYSLPRAPEEISVVEVIEAIEGPIAITECSGDEGACTLEDGCPVRVNWRDISSVIRSALAGVPLARMAGSVLGPRPLGTPPAADPPGLGLAPLPPAGGTGGTGPGSPARGGGGNQR